MRSVDLLFYLCLLAGCYGVDSLIFLTHISETPLIVANNLKNMYGAY